VERRSKQVQGESETRDRERERERERLGTIHKRRSIMSHSIDGSGQPGREKRGTRKRAARGPSALHTSRKIGAPVRGES
jgi:hypothetical protein